MSQRPFASWYGLVDLKIPQYQRMAICHVGVIVVVGVASVVIVVVHVNALILGIRAIFVYANVVCLFGWFSHFRSYRIYFHTFFCTRTTG